MELNDLINICAKETPMQKFIRGKEMLGQIIKSMPKIPFEEIKLEECYMYNREDLIRHDDSGNPHVNVLLKEKFVYISKILRSIADKTGSGLLVLDGFLHYYNGAYWEKIEESLASDLLALVAIKAGFLPIEAESEVNKKKLLVQLVSDYNCPPQKGNVDTNKPKILVNMKNGTLEYENGEFKLRDFQKGDLIRYQLPFKYDPDATCEKFDKFLDEVLPEKAAQDVLMEMIGYCFIPTSYLKLERSMMLYGEGANGKGVIYELVKEILGKEHVTGFSMAALSFDANTRASLAGNS